MFLLNSCLGLFSAAYSHRLPLLLTYGVNLPSSLTMFLPFILGFSPHPPVSVYGTGTYTLHSGFSCQCGIRYFATLFSLLISTSDCVADLPTTLLSALNGLFLLPAYLILLRPHFCHSCIGSTGISTCCPSHTPLGLCLGPDLPWVDEPSPGILGFSMVKILTLLSLLIPAFSLLSRPHVLPVMLLPTTESSPTKSFDFHSFGA